MPDHKFLESYPLYKKFPMNIPDQLSTTLPKPTISMRCLSDSCKNYDTRPFKMINEYTDTPVSGIPPGKRSQILLHLDVVAYGDFMTSQGENYLILTRAAGAVVLAVYQCTSCETFKRIFILEFSPKLDYVQKVGQFPPWDISIGKELEKGLGEFQNLYKKGLICESQSFGIGAFSYYRRIVEDIINDLLISIEDIIENEEKKQCTESD